MTAKYIPGTGNASAKLMIVAEAPGENEEREGVTLSPNGASGREVHELLKEQGVNINDCYRTNVFKYRPPDNDLKRCKETGHTIEECIPQLWAEVRTIKPNAILALGNLSLSTLTGKSQITKWRGSVLESLDGFPKVIPAIHPAAYLRRRGPGSIPYSARVYTGLDFGRAVKESQTKDLHRNERFLQVARSSMDVYNFFHQYDESYTKVSIDIEVIKCIPICIGLAFSKGYGISIPLLNLNVGKNPFQIPKKELYESWLMIEQMFQRPGLSIIGQNFKFDHQKLYRPCGFSVPPDIYADTMLMASVLHPELPKSLAFLTSIYTNEPYYKDEYKEFNEKKDNLDRVFLYNAKDASVTFEIFEKEDEDLGEVGLDRFYYKKVNPLHRFYMDLEEVGFVTDEDIRKELIEKYSLQEKEGDERLEQLVGHTFNVRSNPEVRKLMEIELGFAHREGYDEDSIVQMLGNKSCDTEIKKEILTTILTQRKTKRFQSGNLYAFPDFDLRMRTSVNICGTETGRTSTSIQDAPVRPTKMGMSFHTIPSQGLGKDIRRMLKPDPGHVLMNVDLSQAETRVVALLSDDEFLLQMFKEGRDIHKYTAMIGLGMSEESASKLTKDSPERFLGKKLRHAGAYDMQALRFRDTVNSDAHTFGINIRLTKSLAETALILFHRASPQIRGKFHKDVKDVLTKTRILQNPFGRRRTFMSRLDDDMFREGYAYIPQSTIGDQTKFAGIEVKKRLPWLKIVAEKHDSLLFMPPIGKEDETWKVAKEEFERPIDFKDCTLGKGELIIPAECEIGENYYDMRPYGI